MENKIIIDLRKKNLIALALDNSFLPEDRIRAVREYFQLGWEEYKLEINPSSQ